MPRIYNGYPCLQAFQTIVETDDGETVAEQVRFQPGEVKEVTEEQLEALKNDDRFTKATDEDDMTVDPPSEDKRLRTMRERLAYESLSPRFINRLTAKAKDIESVGTDQVRQAEQVLRQ